MIDDSHESVTSNITTVAMRRDLRAVVDTFAEYQIGFGNEFHMNSMNGSNIKTSAFRITGIQDNVYLSDIPDSNRITGSLFFFTLPSIGSQSPTVVRRNVGTINYKNGTITLNPVNILAAKLKDNQPIIEIEAIPHSNDVIGLQDLYLQLDISSSIFETVIDDIASGLDPSASNYTVSSSYPNGNLVRSGGPETVVTTGTSIGGSSTSTSRTTIQQSTSTTPSSTTSTTSTAGSSSSSGSISY